MITTRLIIKYSQIHCSKSVSIIENNGKLISYHLKKNNVDMLHYCFKLDNRYTINIQHEQIKSIQINTHAYIIHKNGDFRNI